MHTFQTNCTFHNSIFFLCFLMKMPGEIMSEALFVKTDDIWFVLFPSTVILSQKDIRLVPHNFSLINSFWLLLIYPQICRCLQFIWFDYLFQYFFFFLQNLNYADGSIIPQLFLPLLYKARHWVSPFWVFWNFLHSPQQRIANGSWECFI